MKKFQLAVVSDIHLGHKRNSTEDIINNLTEAFKDCDETSELDMIVLAGDVFDSLLMLPDHVVPIIDNWIINLLKICKKYNIVLRVLEGTPSHDWKQSKRFETWNTLAKIDCDLKYMDSLSIEYIEKFDLNFLYIPDEWEDDPVKTFDQVKTLLNKKNLQSVDYAFMHGQFEFQLPSHVKAPRHRSQDYLNIVNQYIFIGHIHTHSRFERIIAQGSFDRLSHNEEEAKGHVRLTCFENGTTDIVFVENKNAKIFKTIDIRNKDYDCGFKKIDQICKNLPHGSYVRLWTENNNPIAQSLDSVKLKWFNFTWSLKTDENDELYRNDKSSDMGVDYVPVQITRDNIEKLILDRRNVNDIKSVNPEIYSVCCQMLEELK